MYNNNITSLEEYIQLVEELIEFYNTTRIKGKKLIRRKDIRKMENEKDLLYKLEIVIEYLKNTGRYE